MGTWKRVEDKRVEEKRVEEKRVEEKRVEEKRVEEKRVEEKRVEERVQRTKATPSCLEKRRKKRSRSRGEWSRRRDQCLHGPPTSCCALA